ncbi:hypothetical protein ACH5RR_017825 [Cinchona calisaya]|uniref:Uncharacterized protein n=1 Tax=Cinchona calisaya TaxID=153742 RepID=A0ABD2ZJU8_9GENT
MSKFFNSVVIFFTIFVYQVLAAKKSYIVYLGEHSHGPEVTKDDLDRVTNSHHEFLASFLGSQEDAKKAIFYSYKWDINGFAATLEEEDAAKIAKHPDVVSVILNEAIKLHTTHSWNFLNLEGSDGVVPRESLWQKANFGQDVIIGSIDTGVWPESPSFGDEGFGPIPPRWKGSCQDSGIKCNRKLIGAKYFRQGLIAAKGNDSSIKYDARDYNGHGTHTLSTVGGNLVNGANVFGLGNGTIKGGAPKARLAAYKVCWFRKASCFAADLLQAFDVAIHDGVDLISISIGGPPTDYFRDAVAIGAFHAVRHKIVVIASGGNDGPRPETISNVAPWIITVAASNMDRAFLTSVQFPNGRAFRAEGIFNPLPERKFYQLIDAAEAYNANSSVLAATVCQNGALDRQKVEGKIIVCRTGVDVHFGEKSYSAAQAGAVGMIMRNDLNFGNAIYQHISPIPAVNIGYDDGISLLQYINSTRHPMGYIQGPLTLLPAEPAPFLASFSSRGPNRVTPAILKPDISAPGVNVLAAFSPAAVTPFFNQQMPFNFLSGTSMACPHISGVVALLKSIHPHWSPAAIRSAIMTTAQTKDNTMKPLFGTAFGFGAGHVQPNLASDPGLVYDLNRKDYLHFLCAIGYDEGSKQWFRKGHHKCPKDLDVTSFNYPSITVPKLNWNAPLRVTRTLKNVGDPGTYNATLIQPEGVSIDIEPNVLQFDQKGDEKNFTLTLVTNNLPPNKYVFGELVWSDGTHNVRSPISVASKFDS